MVRIRKRFRVLILSAIVAGVVVPVGFALSVPSDSIAPRTREDRSVAATTSVALTVPALVSTTDTVPGPFLDDVPDAAKLFLIGSLLVGVATAVRKAG
jgi:hypothetical protein